MNSKIARFTEMMTKENISDAIITSYFNLKYFVNVDIETGERLLALIVRENEKPTLLVNELFTAKESEDYDVVYYNDIDDSIKELAKYLKGKRIGIDGAFTSDFLLRLMDEYKAEYVRLSPITNYIRSRKDDEEKKLLIRASQDNDEVMSEIVKCVKIGVTEKELHEKLLKLYEEKTHEPVSFDPIVSFGANCADPHHVSDETVLKEGDTVVLDIGSHYHGYCSDMTRTILGKNEEMEKVYEIVLKANLAAEAMIKPGVKFKEIDKAARDVIEEAGYGRYFTHRTGHGVGLEEHEPYDVSSVDEVTVETGMCFSIEPGIYLPDVGGVRIEDLVIVEDDGALVLNSYTKEKIFY